MSVVPRDRRFSSGALLRELGIGTTTELPSLPGTPLLFHGEAPSRRQLGQIMSDASGSSVRPTPEDMRAVTANAELNSNLDLAVKALLNEGALKYGDDRVPPETLQRYMEVTDLLQQDAEEVLSEILSEARSKATRTPETPQDKTASEAHAPQPMPSDYRMAGTLLGSVFGGGLLGAIIDPFKQPASE